MHKSINQCQMLCIKAMQKAMQICLAFVDGRYDYDQKRF